MSVNYYSLFGGSNGSDHSVSVLEVSSSRFLIPRGFSSERMLHYLPPGLWSDSNSPTEVGPTKKLKTESSETTPLKQATAAASAAASSVNPFFCEIRDVPYIRNSMKFDLTLLNNIDLQSIDFFLVSSIDDLFILPYLTKINKYRAKVFATVAVAQIGEHSLLEFYRLVCQRNRSSESDEAASSKQTDSYFLESEFFDLFEREFDAEINQWVDIFSLEDIKATFKHITTMNFGQTLLLEGTDLSISPLSSGHSIGSAIWVVESSQTKLALLNNASCHSHRHPLSIDASSKLTNIDTLFLAPCLSNTKEDYQQLLKTTKTTTLSEASLVSLIAKLQELLSQQKQNIVIPIRDGLMLLDLLDVLEKKLASFVRQFFVICESANPFIKLGNCNVEFLNERLQKKIYSETPSNPFSSFESMRKNNLISVFPDFIAFQQSSTFITLQSLIQAKSQSIYFVVDSTLRLGNTMQLLKLIDEAMPKTDKFTSTIVLIDPLFQQQSVAAPIIGKFRNQICYQPLEHRMHVSELCDWLKTVAPKSLVYPRKYQEIQMFLEENQIKMTTFVYGNDEAVSVMLNDKQDSQRLVVDRQKAAERVDFFVSEKFPQINSLGLFKSTIGSIDEHNTLTFEAGTETTTTATDNKKKALLFRSKNPEKRRSDLERLRGVFLRTAESLGYTPWPNYLDQARNQPSGGIKLYFRGSKGEILYVAHDENLTQVYSTQKEVIQRVNSIFKKALFIAEIL